jgi:hypothetical protein
MVVVVVVVVVVVAAERRAPGAPACHRLPLQAALAAAGRTHLPGNGDHKGAAAVACHVGGSHVQESHKQAAQWVEQGGSVGDSVRQQWRRES